MAPEVIQCKEYNQKCDIWSAGIILYTLLSGELPFFSKNRNETIELIVKGELHFNRITQNLNNFIEPIWSRISKEAKELIKVMLAYESDERISAKDALSSSWFQKYNTAKQIHEEDLISSLERLRVFRTQMTFQKAVLAYIVSQQITQDEERKLREVFENLDKDKSGSISKDELIQGYYIIYNDEIRAKEAVEKIMKRVDINQNGSIDYNGIIIYLLN